jgi:hypothetical protein
LLSLIDLHLLPFSIVFCDLPLCPHSIALHSLFFGRLLIIECAGQEHFLLQNLSFDAILHVWQDRNGFASFLTRFPFLVMDSTHGAFMALPAPLACTPCAFLLRL